MHLMRSLVAVIRCHLIWVTGLSSLARPAAHQFASVRGAVPTAGGSPAAIPAGSCHAADESGARNGLGPDIRRHASPYGPAVRCFRATIVRDPCAAREDTGPGVCRFRRETSGQTVTVRGSPGPPDRGRAGVPPVGAAFRPRPRRCGGPYPGSYKESAVMLDRSGRGSIICLCAQVKRFCFASAAAASCVSSRMTGKNRKAPTKSVRTANAVMRRPSGLTCSAVEP